MTTPSGARPAPVPPPAPCAVCSHPVTPDEDGTVRIVGLAPREAPRLWVWGPAVVHDECRYDVRTPLDDHTGYLPVEQRVRTAG
ncbi:hypothetical protein LQ327_03170 [Actinomycetospora endophytica]|uniref:Uncharacterized protein n=1 Tax=Actinomycetospora endophytica TaxID=2291215 RepID=A0ABS8P2D9_9PSEU|nr:hypothetical protein [Actinomycetospora endophytica]MCD2192398.1 hypothetical protein [Actinomycetospora endophytica]